MKQAILSILIILYALIGVQAQTQTVIFKYDDAGNRVLRINAKKITKADTLFKSDSLFVSLRGTASTQNSGATVTFARAGV